MKIVVTAKGETPTGELDPHFGRARKFFLFNDDTGLFSAHDNAQNLNASQGAGIQAAESVVRLGTEAVITGHVGPKAFKALKSAGVRIFLAPTGTTVTAAIKAFQKNDLEEASGATKEGHWI